MLLALKEITIYLRRAWELFWAGGGVQRCRELLADGQSEASALVPVTSDAILRLFLNLQDEDPQDENQATHNSQRSTEVQKNLDVKTGLPPLRCQRGKLLLMSKEESLLKKSWIKSSTQTELLLEVVNIFPITESESGRLCSDNQVEQTLLSSLWRFHCGLIPWRRKFCVEAQLLEIQRFYH